MKITKYLHDSPKLWGLLGPLAFRKDVIAELGGNLSNDDNYTWYLATEDSKVLGFSATEQKKSGAWIRHSWVSPEHRKGKIYSQMLTARLNDIWEADNAMVTCVSTAASKKALEKQKFVCIATRGKYFTMRLKKI